MKYIAICYLLLAWSPAGYAQSASPVADKIRSFVKKYRAQQQDVTIVLLDGSISTDMGYASKRPDAAYRPPCCTEYNIPSFIEEKLRWKSQQFRRYDANTSEQHGLPVFTETGAAVTSQYDSAWDWQNKPPVSNGYNGLTRILSGQMPAVSWSFPTTAKRCDLIYRTDYLSSAALRISVAGKKGVVQVYDEIARAWTEAENFVFSARETDSLIHGSFFPGKSFGATSLRKSIYQQRLKLRSLVPHRDIKVMIRSEDGGRLCYWGIVYSSQRFMLQFINNARGGHDIAHLEPFESWSVDGWKPDLILYSCNTINEGADASAGNATNSPTAFTDRFEKFIRKLKAKPYTPDIFAYILFTAKAHNLVDSLDHVGAVDIPGYGKATVFTFIDSLYQRLQTMPIASANVFYHYWETARKKASGEHTTIYTQLFGNSGPTGQAFVGDDTHLNNQGARTGWSYLQSCFDFR